MKNLSKLLIAAMFLWLTGIAGAAEFRSQMKLSNVWECCPIVSKEKPKKEPANNKFIKVTLPKNKFWLRSNWRFYPDVKYLPKKVQKASNWCWYKQCFKLPANFKKERIFLQFNGIYFQYYVWLNGHKLGHNEHGYFPYAFDVTRYIKTSGKNDLLILVGDSRTIKNAPKGAMARFERGLSGNVVVYSVNNTHLEDVFIKTSFRNKTIQVDLEITTPQKNMKTILTVLNTRGKKTALPFKRLKDGKDCWQARWANPELWSPEHPYLYKLRVELVSADGKKLDEQTIPFGFREFYIKGHSFYLNGKKTQLRCQWGHIGEWLRARYGKGKRSKPVNEEFTIKNLKDKNINIVRYHCQPFPKLWYDTADRNGMLVIAESGLNHGPVSAKSVEHVKRFIKTYRNHPSIVIWSLNNEFAHWLSPRSIKISKFLFELEKNANELDPTRPVQHSGYGILNKDQQTINVHYPVGIDQLLLPNCFYWMRSGKYINHIYKSHPWKKDKPLLIGEQLLPWGGEIWSVLAGEKIYKENYYILKKSKTLAETMGQVYRMMVENGRVGGVAMMSVIGGRNLSSPYDDVKAYIFDPRDGFMMNRGLRFWSEEQAGLKYFAWNDDPGKLIGKLEMKVQTGFTPASLTQDVCLAAGESRTYNFDIKARKTEKVLRSELKINLGKAIDQKYQICVFPCKYITVSRKGALFISENKNEVSMMKRYFALPGKITAKITPDLLKNTQLLVISGLLLPKLCEKDFRAVNLYCQNGGKVILLASEKANNSCYDWLPIPLITSHKPLSITFPHIASDILFKHLKAADLRFWRENNIVARFAFNKPTSGNFIPLCDAGSANGLSLTPLIELKKGKGGIWANSYSFSDKISKDPAAALLFSNLLEYALDRKFPPFVKAEILLGCKSSDLLKILQKFRLKCGVNTTLPTAERLMQSNLIISDGKSLAKVLPLKIARKYLDAGKTIYIHQLTPQQKSYFERLCGQKISFSKYKPANYIPDLQNSPLVTGVSLSDLAWGNPGKQKFSPLAQTLVVLSHPHAAQEAFKIPGLLFSLKSGLGRIVVDQLNWNTEELHSGRALRFGSQLLNNLGVEMKSMPYKVLTNLKYFPLDLNDKYNSTFSLSGIKNMIGYFNDVKDDKVTNKPYLHAEKKSSNMLYFKYKDIPFELKLKGMRSISVKYPGKRHDKLEGVDDIIIPRKNSHVEKIYFFHVMRVNWNIKMPRYNKIGYYRINYHDGSSEEVPLVKEINLAHYRRNYPDGLPKAKMVMRIKDGPGDYSSLFCIYWQNPFPEKKIRSIDLVPGVNLRNQPFLLAVTLKASDVHYE
jgi:uncharacterized C2H2 Zn-finger protein